MKSTDYLKRCRGLKLRQIMHWGDMHSTRKTEPCDWRQGYKILTTQYVGSVREVYARTVGLYIERGFNMFIPMQSSNEIGTSFIPIPGWPHSERNGFECWDLAQQVTL